MASSPPISTRPLGLPRLLRRRPVGAARPASLCFAVADAPPAASRSVPGADGGMTLLTELSGQVVSCTRGCLVLDDRGARTHVRYLLPEAACLEALVDHGIRIEVRHELAGDPRRTPTVDARILSPEGTLLLWARDGALPTRSPERGAAVRVRCDDRGAPRLAVAWRGAVASAATAEVGEVGPDRDRLLVLPLRVAADEAAFVLARGE